MRNDTVKEESFAVLIRDVEDSDCAAIVVLLAELGYPHESRFVAQKIEQLKGTQQDRIIVAAHGAEIIGLASLHTMPLLHLAGNLCRVTSLVVSRAYRRKHVGKRLLEAAEAYAKTAGCVKMEITSGDQRSAAHAFYERLGYEEVSRRFVKMI
jgi:GNAT superfamily N-acetyltransferase